MTRTKVFISYSHKDGRWLDRLATHLKPLEHQGDVDPWDDRRIEPGSLWRDKIRDALDAAAVGVLLVSQDFLASRYIAEHEVRVMLEAASAAGMRILCLYVRPSGADDCRYEYVDGAGVTRTRVLTEFQGLNDPKSPLAKLRPAAAWEEALVKAAKTIRDQARLVADLVRPTPSRQVAVDPRPYLMRLRDDTRMLALDGIADKQARRIELTRVYTRLHVAPQADPGAPPGVLRKDSAPPRAWSVMRSAPAWN